MQHKLISISNWFVADNSRVRLAIILATLVVAVLTGSAALAGDATSGS